MILKVIHLFGTNFLKIKLKMFEKIYFILRNKNL